MCRCVHCCFAKKMWKALMELLGYLLDVITLLRLPLIFVNVFILMCHVDSFNVRFSILYGTVSSFLLGIGVNISICVISNNKHAEWFLMNDPPLINAPSLDYFFKKNKISRIILVFQKSLKLYPVYPESLKVTLQLEKKCFRKCNTPSPLTRTHSQPHGSAY